MIRVRLLPAACGDCILIEYGDAPSRVLIDAGFKRTYDETLRPHLDALGAPVPLDLLVVTHIDRDHISGALPLLDAAPALVDPSDIWFNGKKHLASDHLGAAHGDALATILEARFPSRWNAAAPFRGKAVRVLDAGQLPAVTLIGGATLTLLSPYADALRALDDHWQSETADAWGDAAKPARVSGDDKLGQRRPLASVDAAKIRALAAKATDEDDKPANGSSIAFIFEYAGRRVLFTGDAHPSVLLRSLERYQPDGRVALDAFKLSHHGSGTNLSDTLLDKIDCANWLVSTDGSSFGHPHGEAIAKIIVRPGKKSLHFNALSPWTRVWNDAAARRAFDYDTAYPERAAEGCVLKLL